VAEPGPTTGENAVDEAEGASATAAETADAPAVDSAAEAPAEESTSTADAPYGEGSHAPLADPSEAPEGFPIKGNEDSKIYHVPESPHYGRTVAEVWFATPAAAEAAGFEPPAVPGA
jgi:large subunit ribosomal protein L17